MARTLHIALHFDGVCQSGKFRSSKNDTHKTSEYRYEHGTSRYRVGTKTSESETNGAGIPTNR